MADDDAPQLEKGQRLICLGDESCLPFAGTIFRSPSWHTPFLVESAYIPGFSAADMISEANGVETIGEKVRAALAPFHVLAATGEALWRSPSVEDARANFASGFTLCAPFILIFCGEGDLRRSVYPAFAETSDFVLPGDPAPLLEGREEVSFEQLRDRLTALLAPIVKGMRALHAAGLSRSVLAMIPPARSGDDAFAAANGYRCPLAIRRKLVALANSILAELSASIASPFLEVVEPRLTEFIQGALDHPLLQSDRHNSVLYVHASRIAVQPEFAGTPRYQEAQDEFNARGVIARQIDPARILPLVEELNFDLDVGNRHRSPFWFGNPAKPFKDTMRTLIPGVALLQRVHQIVYSPEILSCIQACLGSDPYFINTRFFLSLPHDVGGDGPQGFHRDGSPPGLIRGLIYLVDVDEGTGPFEYLDENRVSHLVAGSAGTLLIFDANRLIHRGSPPRAKPRKAIDFCILPRPAAMPRRVMWAGMNNWPLDPFQYPVDRMQAYPEFADGWVRINPVSGL